LSSTALLDNFQISVTGNFSDIQSVVDIFEVTNTMNLNFSCIELWYHIRRVNFTCQVIFL